MRITRADAGWLAAAGLALVSGLLAARLPPSRIAAESAALRTENAASEAVGLITREASTARSGSVLARGLRLERRDGATVDFVVERGVLREESGGVEVALLDGIEAAEFRSEDGGRFVRFALTVRDRGAAAPRTLHARIPWPGARRSPGIAASGDR